MSCRSLAGRTPAASIVVRPVRGRLHRDFVAEELACPCEDCTRLVVHWALVLLLQRIRDRLGPLLVTSGHRCPDHNREVGGVSSSLHLAGMAADVRARDTGLQHVAETAREVGAGGVGLYPHHVHVDVGEQRRWTGDYD